MFELFDGLKRAHGIYQLTDIETDAGKRVGKAITVKEDITVDKFKRHLTDEHWMLGVIPVRDDAMCKFGVIDVDQYQGLDHKAVLKKVCDYQLPLVATKSKSGGMHLYTFFKEPVSAPLVRKKLKQWGDALGFTGVEVFPKQDELSHDSVGNWINLPYGAHFATKYGSDRFGYDDKGNPIAHPADWIKYADKRKVSKAAFAKIDPPDIEYPFADGPPCLQQLCTAGIPKGGRNNALYQMAVYAREKFGDAQDWITKVYEMNRTHMDPPLKESEVQVITKSVSAKGYYYKCKDEPMAAVCKRHVCLQRTYGIGEGGGESVVEFGSIQKMLVLDPDGQPTDDPPRYFWTLNGKVVGFDMAELQSQARFAVRVAEKIDKLPPRMREADWRALINDALAKLDTVHAPFESGAYGQFMSYLYQFIEEYGEAQELHQLFEGWAFIDAANERAYFRWHDLREYLDRKRFTVLSQKHMWSTMRRYASAVSKESTVHNRSLRYWSVEYRPQKGDELETSIKDQEF
jgi:hypothetical protein